MLKLWKKWECYFREYTAIQLMKKVYNVHTFTCNSLCTLHNYRTVTCQTQVIVRITGNQQHFEKNSKYCTIFRFPWILVSCCDSVNGAENADLNSFEGLLRCKIEVGDIHKYYNFNCFKHRSWSWIFRYETAVTTCIVISYNYLLTNTMPNYVNLPCKKSRISVILIGCVC